MALEDVDQISLSRLQKKLADFQQTRWQPKNTSPIEKYFGKLQKILAY